MSEIKPGDRVRVVQDHYAETYRVTDMIGTEGTAAKIGAGPYLPREDPDPTWVEVAFGLGITGFFRPDELEVIEL